MPKRDLQILKNASEPNITFSLLGASTDTGLMLLQRLYVLLFSELDSGFRDGPDGYSLLQFIQGGNIPDTGTFEAILAVATAAAVRALDPEDIELVNAFDGTIVNGEILCVLELKDDLTMEGPLNND